MNAADHHQLVRCRERYKAVRKSVPLSMRSIVHSITFYSCDEGITEDEGPFAGEHQPGCGWARVVYVGIGVGRSVGKEPVLDLPDQAGNCERCGGPLTHQKGSEQEALSVTRAPDGVAVARVPNKRFASRMAHEGKAVAQVVAPEDWAAKGDPERALS